MREIKFKFVFEHPKSNEIIISRSFSLEEILETNDDEIYSKTCRCSCSPIGETNVVECGNGCDYYDEFIVIGKLQFTGLKDKNGKEIYEGDIIEFRNIDNSIPKLILPVVWDEKGCGFECNDGKNCRGVDMASGFHTISGEIIGNIYQNPELLK